MSPQNPWAEADRISDQIIRLLRTEIARPDFNPTQIFAGQCLALLGFMKTAPIESMPPSFGALKEVLELVLLNMTAGMAA
jgi:hypothetical protein